MAEEIKASYQGYTDEIESVPVDVTYNTELQQPRKR